MKTIIFRIIDILNDKQIISDNTFYYLLDTLPECLTIPPEYAEYYTLYGTKSKLGKQVIVENNDSN